MTSASSITHLADDPALAIAAIRTTVFRLPMQEPLRWGKAGVLDEVRHVLVEVELADGAVGVAEAPPRPTIYGETVHSIVSIVRTELAPRILGRTPAAVPAQLATIANNHVAKGALDMALHDAVARSSGVPLAEHLGASHKEVRVSYILGLGEEDQTLAEAARVYEQGVRVLKVKVGRDWTADLARLQRLRTHLPGDMALYADANECFEPATAASRLDALHELGLLYCEEPLPVECVRARTALRRRSALPLIGDDSCFTPRDLRRELALDTIDLLNVKTPRTGYTDSIAMAAMAQAAGKGVMVGSQASAGLGAARAALFAARCEVEHPSEISFFLKLREDIVARPLQITDGVVALADAASVRIDRDLLREAAVALN